MYEVDGEAGRGYVTEHVDGIGTMAGPPARGTTPEMVAGRPLVTAAKATVKDKLVVVEVRIFELWQWLHGSERRSSLTMWLTVGLFDLEAVRISSRRCCVSQHLRLLK